MSRIHLNIILNYKSLIIYCQLFTYDSIYSLINQLQILLRIQNFYSARNRLMVLPKKNGDHVIVKIKPFIIIITITIISLIDVSTILQSHITITLLLL